QAQACYGLAASLRSQAETAYKGKQPGGDKLEKEAERCYELIIEKYGDLKHFRGTMAEAAKGDLYELRHLSLGKTAPEIEGDDIDGKKLKLSEYRGKVILLDFWGNW